jgi:hypothetical protein
LKLENYSLIKEEIWQIGSQLIKDEKFKKDFKDQFNAGFYIKESDVELKASANKL